MLSALQGKRSALWLRSEYRQLVEGLVNGKGVKLDCFQVTFNTLGPVQALL